MPTGPEYFDKATRFARYAVDRSATDAERAEDRELAQLHATLALVVATVEAAAGTVHSDWLNVIEGFVPRPRRSYDDVAVRLGVGGREKDQQL